MRRIGLIILTVLLVASCNQSAVQAPAPTTGTGVADRDGVFIHITQCYDDPHRVLMPLKMALMMSDDKDVIVYLDIHAVQFLAKDSQDINFADFESAHTYIKKLSEKGVGVYACSTCMKIAGITPEDLIQGVQVAQKDKFFNFTKGRIITIDY
ncbi:MAG TPA: DsrE family protein [Bacteroidales bacterium]|nr:DsrE family protein [Bacteroidales bacterium]